MKDIFNYNPKKWYDLVKKKLSGKQISNIDFQLDEPSIKTANDLNKHQIVQALPPLSAETLESIPHSQVKTFPINHQRISRRR